MTSLHYEITLKA